MNLAIQPKYETIRVECNCGKKFETRSTACRDLYLDVCDACHPFYTKTQKLVDTAGRVDKFLKKFKNKVTDAMQK